MSVPKKKQEIYILKIRPQLGTKKLNTILLNNDYQEIFKPFYFVDSIFGLRVYNYKNGLAHPVKLWNKFLGVLSNVAMLTSLVYTIKWSHFPDSKTKCIYYFQYFLHSIVFLVFTIHNWIMADTHFCLMKNLQDLGETLQVSQVRWLKASVWCFLSYTCSYYTIFVYIRCTSDPYWVWGRAVIITNAVLFEMYIMNVAVTMFYMAIKLKNWRNAVLESIGEELDKAKQMVMMSIFERILESYALTKRAFKFIVLVCMVVAFLEFLTLEGLFIIWAEWDQAISKYSELSAMTCLLYGWMSKMIALQVALCVACEKFYLELNNVREMLVRNTLRGYSEFHVVQTLESWRRFGKSTCQLIDSHFSKMTACSVFTIDASLLFRFVATVATYTIVLLQFAL